MAASPLQYTSITRQIQKLFPQAKEAGLHDDCRSCKQWNCPGIQQKEEKICSDSEIQGWTSNFGLLWAGKHVAWTRFVRSLFDGSTRNRLAPNIVGKCLPNGTHPEDKRPDRPHTQHSMAVFGNEVQLYFYVPHQNKGTSKTFGEDHSQDLHLQTLIADVNLQYRLKNGLNCCQD